MKKDKWVQGYLDWKEKLSKEDYETYVEGKFDGCEEPVKGSLPPCPCEYEMRPLTEEEDKAVSWLSELLKRYKEK